MKSWLRRWCMSGSVKVGNIGFFWLATAGMSSLTSDYKNQKCLIFTIQSFGILKRIVLFGQIIVCKRANRAMHPRFLVGGKSGPESGLKPFSVANITFLLSFCSLFRSSVSPRCRHTFLERIIMFSRLYAITCSYSLIRACVQTCTQPAKCFVGW